ncbi:alpha/beta-hydrolase [Basidiobolus meristosporus CBS 931.73]|uniref:Alpha/beta-hydrolase n=1 Tax=Basidiobolus meristosporus CBS 931.73 TaxID=1314790 RepID=A0A1Y1Z7D4_9FUNG|nr:alpha/beta-hydrolase [Basidiobolus meristosporus CBS 931.73]|eukprot:ORY06192.1 alpha/beta-hydrolase [Basidiobolus meristosporus CBS 931.73]
MMPVQHTTLFLQSSYQQEKRRPVLLETRLSYSPEELSKKAEITGIVLSHPYGPLGGNYDNNVVRKLHSHFAKKGLVVVSFNARGSGNSSGRTSWTGIPETEDIKIIVGFLAKEEEVFSHTENAPDFPKPSKIVICGYSYGSVISSSLRPMDFPNVKLFYAFISYPLSVVWLLTLWKCNWFFKRVEEIMGISKIPSSPEQSSLNENIEPQPVLFIYGDSDQFTSLSSYQKWLRKFPAELQNIQPRLIEGCDHFWFGKENKIAQCIEDWLNEVVIHNTD